jgi:hypothetical protein
MKQMVAVSALLLFVTASVAGAAEDLQVNEQGDVNYSINKIQLTYPNHNGVVSGYFIPVSWSDSAVERLNDVYPDNYERTGKKYSVTISTTDGEVLLKRKIENSNFCIFTYPEIDGLLEQRTYRVSVSLANSRAMQDTASFYYRKPLAEMPLDTDLENDIYRAPDESENRENVQTLRSYGSCPYCEPFMWPGMLAIMLSPTTYSKTVTITCNSTVWYNNTFPASFSGPVFISLSTGTYKVSYYDRIVSTYACPHMRPFAFTVVEFP